MINARQRKIDNGEKDYFEERERQRVSKKEEQGPIKKKRETRCHIKSRGRNNNSRRKTISSRKMDHRRKTIERNHRKNDRLAGQG